MSRSIDAKRVLGIGVAVALAEVASVGPVASASEHLNQAENQPAGDLIGPREIYPGTVPLAILSSENQGPLKPVRIFNPKDGLGKESVRPQVHGIRQGSSVSSHGNRFR